MVAEGGSLWEEGGVRAREAAERSRWVRWSADRLRDAAYWVGVSCGAPGALQRVLSCRERPW